MGAISSRQIQRGRFQTLTIEKNENLNLAEGVEDFNLSSLEKLLNITNLHEESDIKNNIFELKFLLEILITKVELLREEQKSLQRAQALQKQEFPKMIWDELIRVNGGL